MSRSFRRGKETRLRPLADDKSKCLVEVAGPPILTHCVDELLDQGQGSDRGRKLREIPVHRVLRRRVRGRSHPVHPQGEQLGLASAWLTAEAHVTGEFILVLRDNIFQPRGSE